MRKVKSFPGREIHGLRLRAYPTPEQEIAMLDLQRRLRRFWNWLVARARDTRSANEAWAAKNGAGPRPQRPANDAGEKAWKEYKEAMSEWRKRVKTVLAPTKKDPRFRYRTLKDYKDHFGEGNAYNIFRHIFDDDEQPAAHLLDTLLTAYKQALSATARGQAPPRAKKRDEDVLLQAASGKRFRLKQEDGGRIFLGKHPKGAQMSGRINAEVSLPNVPGWIACHLSPEQPLESDPKHWVEGVALRKEPDGWFAAIKHHVEKRPAPRGKGACGIDVGLVELFAVVGDDGQTKLAGNIRKGSKIGKLKTPGGYIELIAHRQSAGLPVSKFQRRMKRHIREFVRRELFPFTDRYEFIAVEDLKPDVGFGHTPHLSFMRTIRTMLIQRYGCERVIDVDATNTSRTCSMCGTLQKVSWSELQNRIGKCHHCGHEEHSDLNAARNVLHRLTKSQGAQPNPPQSPPGPAGSGTSWT